MFSSRRPFLRIFTKIGFIFFQKRIIMEIVNGMMTTIQGCMGKKEHDKIRDKPIMCMGVRGGNANLAKQMIKWMVHSVYEQPKGGSDQVRGNRFRHLNRSNGELEVHKNGSSSVLHIHKAELLGDSDSTIAHVRGNRIAAKQDDSVIPIIHMYNRHPHALEIANHLRSE